MEHLYKFSFKNSLFRVQRDVQLVKFVSIQTLMLVKICFSILNLIEVDIVFFYDKIEMKMCHFYTRVWYSNLQKKHVLHLIFNLKFELVQGYNFFKKLPEFRKF